MKKILLIITMTFLLAACKKDPLPQPAPKPLKDIDGNGYDTVKIGTQFWMKQNLTTAHYKNGDPIPEITSVAVWATLTTGAWCWYNNDSATYAATYGKLYNWLAVKDPRGLAPAGYHIPSDAEWTSLSNFLAGNPASPAGGKMKETGTTHWGVPNFGATNSSGFTGLPGGLRVNNFNSLGSECFWWSTTELNASSAWYRSLASGNSELWNFDLNKRFGLSVRCLRD